MSFCIQIYWKQENGKYGAQNPTCTMMMMMRRTCGGITPVVPKRQVCTLRKNTILARRMKSARPFALRNTPIAHSLCRSLFCVSLLCSSAAFVLLFSSRHKYAFIMSGVERIASLVLQRRTTGVGSCTPFPCGVVGRAWPCGRRPDCESPFPPFWSGPSAPPSKTTQGR